jgi:tetratricopeptide (TPR) repeat protein
LNPRSIEAKEGLALMRGARGRDWQACLEALTQTLVETTEAGLPELTEISIAWAHHMQGDDAKALEFFDRALDHMSNWPTVGVELDAQCAEMECQIGALYHSLKSDQGRALEHLRRAAELSPESVFASEARALIEEITGGREPAD